MQRVVLGAVDTKMHIHTYRQTDTHNTMGETIKHITPEAMIRVTKERTPCQEIPLSQVDNLDMNKAKKSISSR